MIISYFNYFLLLILTLYFLSSCETNPKESTNTNATTTKIDSSKIKTVDTPIDELPIIEVKDASLVLPKHYKETTDSSDWVDTNESIDILKQNCPAGWDDEVSIVLVDIFDAAYQFPNGKKAKGKACELLIFFPNDDDDSKNFHVRVGVGGKFKAGKHRFKILELYTGNNNYKDRPIKAKIQKLK